MSADRVAALPYDVYNRGGGSRRGEERTFIFFEDRTGQKLSLMTVLIHMHRRFMTRQKEIFESMVADGIYVTDDDECYYIYRLTMDGREQTGDCCLCKC